jgi:hypothetical protein
MKQLIHLLVGLALCACSSSSLAQAWARIIPGPEVQVSQGEDFAHVETMLAVNPTDPRHWLASCIILPKNGQGEFLFRCRAYVSRDTGLSWKPSRLPDETHWDPIAAFTPAGTPLLACLPPKRLGVFRSEDNGSTWKEQRRLPKGDHPMMAVDGTSAKRKGAVYIAASNDDGQVLVHRSDDDGRSFKTTVALKGFKVGWVNNLLVLQDGTLFIPLQSGTANGVEKLSCLYSSDGGSSFSQPALIATRTYKGTGQHGDNEPAYAAGIHAGKRRIFAVYGDWRGDANARLVLSYSDDLGRTWSQPKAVANDAADGATQGAANVTVNSAGIVGMSWLERRIGPTPQLKFKKGQEVVFDFDETYDLLFTVSLDAGETFLSPVMMTSRPSKPLSKHASRFMPGTDYMLAAAAPDGAFHLLWPDARTGIFQLYTRAVRVE